MQHISWQQAADLCYVLGPYRSPIATVSPGETFTVETLDAFGGRVTSQDTPPSQVLALPYVNPVTGPIYIQGAEKGDTLAVTIVDIKASRDFGVSATIPEFGGLCGTFLTRTLNEPLEERVWVHPIGPSGIVFDPGLDIPAIPFEPFYGTIGTSPELEAISTLAPGFHGGNMDAPDMCPGNTAYFPVNVPGALLHLGDGHAAQGDGEVAGTAIEMDADVTLTTELIKDGPVLEQGPHYEGPARLMDIPSRRFYATTGLPLKAAGEIPPDMAYLESPKAAGLENLSKDISLAARNALLEIIDYMVRTYDLTPEQAYIVASVAVDLRIGQLVDVPNVGVTAILPLDIFDAN